MQGLRSDVENLEAIWTRKLYLLEIRTGENESKIVQHNSKIQKLMEEMRELRDKMVASSDIAMAPCVQSSPSGFAVASAAGDAANQVIPTRVFIRGVLFCCFA
jgi:hypothetical protein